MTNQCNLKTVVSLCVTAMVAHLYQPVWAKDTDARKGTGQSSMQETNSKISNSKICSSKTSFGKTKDGKEVHCVTLRNAQGTEARIITYGATLISMEVPDRKGKRANVILGFDNLADYESKSPYFGATVGRCANRIANATFDLDGKTYKLAANDGPNTLHGGLKAFDKKVWEITSLDPSKAEVTLKLLSKDMDEGFPGNLEVFVTYSLVEGNALTISYSAITDEATPVNLTNHAYFNLAGAGNGDVLDQLLTIHSKFYTPVNKDLIPTGEIAPVAGTPFDFNSAHKIGERINDVAGGYDHNFVIDRSGDGLINAALAEDLDSGRFLEFLTTEPGVQVYSGNFLDGTLSGSAGRYVKHSAFTFEAQHYPDAVHHANFPSIILRPGEKYKQTTVYKFSVR